MKFEKKLIKEIDNVDFNLKFEKVLEKADVVLTFETLLFEDIALGKVTKWDDIIIENYLPNLKKISNELSDSVLTKIMEDKIFEYKDKFKNFDLFVLEFSKK